MKINVPESISGVNAMRFVSDDTPHAYSYIANRSDL
jgi:hypothetical protein